jgi:1-acyl-sn-glycerol-3-phosphate acyltransferase
VILATFFGKIKGGNMIYFLCKTWADIIMPPACIFHKNIFEVPHDPSKQYVFVFNHISFIDIPCLMKAIRKQHFRILGRADLAKIPIFGFLYKNAVVSVDRNDPVKRKQSIKELKETIATGISVVIAPEGTFNTTHQPLKEFYNGAFKVAIETQTPIKPILFLDNYDRLPYERFLSLTPGKTRCIYLEEIAVDSYAIEDVELLKQKVYSIMQQKLIAYNASWIKTTP